MTFFSIFLFLFKLDSVVASMSAVFSGCLYVGEMGCDSILDFIIVFDSWETPICNILPALPTRSTVWRFFVMTFCFFTAALSCHISPFSYLAFTQIHWSLRDIVKQVIRYNSIKYEASKFSSMLSLLCFFILCVVSHPQLSILIHRYVWAI